MAGELFATPAPLEDPARFPHARRRRKGSGRRGRASPAGHSGASRQPGVRDAWGLEAPVPVSGGKHTSPELVVTKERTFPLTCCYGCYVREAQERRVRRAMAPRKMRDKRGAAEGKAWHTGP